MTIERRSIAVAGTGTPSARLRDITRSVVLIPARLLGAVRTWASASQLGPMPEKEIGRRTGART